MSLQAALVANGTAVPLADIPEGSVPQLRSLILEKVAGGSHLASFFPFMNGDRTMLMAVLTNPEEGGLAVGMAEVGDSYTSLTPECAEANLFEREIAENCGIVPRGHPWLKPVRFTGAVADGRLPASFTDKRVGAMDFFRVEGEEIHEVAVGPVHAGVIEPGHFRFQCHGEEVIHLEISLGYQHRGAEMMLRSAPVRRGRYIAETVAGDTSCGHGLAYAMTVEALAGLGVTDSADRVRAIGLELERIANHTGDLGALSGDVGFLPTASYCGRLRGDILNLTALIAGNRFGRGLIVPGGVGYPIDGGMAGTIRERLAVAWKDIRGAVDLLFRRPSVLARFEETGTVPRHTADHLGLVGPAARASGLEVDVRHELPTGAYRREEFPLELQREGDVLARARQRYAEMATSVAFIDRLLQEDCAAPRPANPDDIVLRPDHFAVSLVEGWRGQVCHIGITGGDGLFHAYKIVDPSFHNWTGLAMALRGQLISDFPLCNKSFNLSYCGFDL